jgi:hypothetical protein
MNFAPRAARLLAAALLASVAATGQAKLTGNGGPAPTVNNIGGFVVYDNPQQADFVDSDLLDKHKNDFWRYTVEEKALDGDAMFNDVVITGRHKGLYENDNFDATKPGPLLTVTFKNIAVGVKYDAKTDTGKHADGEDTLHVSFLVLQGNNFSEILVNLNHFGAAAPVPEPSTWGLMLAGLAGLAWRGTKRRR